MSNENSKRSRGSNRVALAKALMRSEKKTKTTKVPLYIVPTMKKETVRKPKPIDTERKDAEARENEGKVLCGALHPKNGVECTVPVDEHGDKHSGWMLNQRTFNMIRWDKQ